jgi:GTP cyclohydrolase I
VGLSKIPIVDAFARRMQVQERLTDQIRTAFKALSIHVAVVIEAQHMCMQMRNSETKFSYYDFFFTGAFEKTKLEKNLSV